MIGNLESIKPPVLDTEFQIGFSSNQCSIPVTNK